MKQLLWLAGLVIMTLAQTAEAAVAGRFQFVSGEVKVTSATGQERIVQKGDEISQGDTITSSSSASAQVKMADDGLIIVRPDTKMRITTFQYNGKADGSERSLISLVEGGFRAITGMIGRLNKENYKIETPTATIGIRGTDHEPMFIPNPVAGKVAIAEPGTYDKVNSGAAVLSTSKGLVVINPNQAGFVPNVANAAPTVLTSIPAFYKVAPSKDEPKIVPGARLQPGGGQQPTQAGSTTEKADSTARVVPGGTPALTTKSATGALTTKTGVGGAVIAPATTISPTTKTTIAPTTLTTTIQPVTTTTIAPTTTIQPITTTTIAPTTTIQPITTTTTIAPTTTIQPITTTTIAPTTTIQPITTTTIAPTTLTTTIQPITTTTIAPTTTIQPITTTTIAPTTTIQPITTTTTIAPTTTTTTTIQPITTTIQPTTTFSDRRLKKNIKRVGTHRLGIGIYEFDYIWGEHAIGVMADEVRLVRPEAVLRDASGYDMVDYSKLD